MKYDIKDETFCENKKGEAEQNKMHFLYMEH